MQERLCRRHVVLLGVGHTNAHVVRMWGMHALPDTDLTCLSDNSIATYSGMLPATLAGQNPRDEMEIDLVRLCGSVGARLITAPVVGLDLTRREVQFATRPAIPFDALSIGVGSVPTLANVEVSGETLVKIKPMQTFLARLRAVVCRTDVGVESRALRVVVVGSGVAGIEITCCLPPFLQSVGVDRYALHIVTRSPCILPEVNASARRVVDSDLQLRGVAVTVNRGVRSVGPTEVELDDGSKIPADVVIWATGASPPPLLANLGLPLDERGFIATDNTLRSTSGQPVFAVGDSGTICGENLPKAGVYAVRQGPVLWRNLGRLLAGHPLEAYRPQRSFLKLINLGDGTAVGHWRAFAFSGRWVMRWKNRIDQQFMEKFQPRSMSASGTPMQCRGCGSKLGSQVLQSALDADENDPFYDNHTDKIALEDAAEIGNPGGQRLIASTDFFSSPLDDAFLSGRIAALHAASDIIACGGSPTQALANVVLLEGDRKAQRRSLSDFLAGARLEFNAMGAAIVGGHTIVGPRMEVGFTVIGQPLGDQLVSKSNLAVGDQLFLTKPLGIGVLLAAHMRNRCAARDFDRLLEVMLTRQHAFASICAQAGIRAGTDVTGFGLAGHLLEMLATSRLSGTIFLDSIPALDGALAAIEAGIESSLIDDNLSADDQIDAMVDVRRLAKYRLLFDPQTCGGFLFGCAESAAVALQELAMQAGLAAPQWIGCVHASTPAQPALKVELKCRATDRSETYN